MPAATSRRTWTSRSTPTPTHDPMLPYTLVLKPGLGIHSIYDGYWFWVGPRSRTCAATCAR
jgi:hypothetical protein